MDLRVILSILKELINNVGKNIKYTLLLLYYILIDSMKLTWWTL